MSSLKIHVSQILWQKVEGLAVFALGTFGFYLSGGTFGWYIVGLLAADITLIGYLFGKNNGATLYNLGHNFALPLALSVGGYFSQTPGVTQAGLLWLAHVGMDRAFGYGLKHPHGFHHTHLGNIGSDKLD